jgi:hypothetical protein
VYNGYTYFGGKNMEKHYIYDSDMNLKKEIEGSYRIVKTASVNAFKKNLKLIEKLQEEGLETFDIKNINFSMNNEKELRLLMPDLDNSEKCLLFSMMPYVSFIHNCVQYGNGVDIGTEDMIEISGLSKGTVYTCVDSLISKDILYKGKNSKKNQFYINPWLIHKGQVLNVVLKNMFKNYYIRSKEKFWKDL